MLYSKSAYTAKVVGSDLHAFTNGVEYSQYCISLSILLQVTRLIITGIVQALIAMLKYTNLIISSAYLIYLINVK